MVALQRKDKRHRVLVGALVDPFVCKAMMMRLMTRSSTPKKKKKDIVSKSVALKIEML